MDDLGVPLFLETPIYIINEGQQDEKPLVFALVLWSSPQTTKNGRLSGGGG